MLRHEVTLPRCFIARYPVTVAQFRVFMEASGQRLEDDEALQITANHPVVWVSWYGARRYCEWLTGSLRSWPGTPEAWAILLRQEDWQVMLPSEAE
jgi:formylglycine-generating enzyme required for sulfatase activity